MQLSLITLFVKHTALVLLYFSSPSYAYTELEALENRSNIGVIQLDSANEKPGPDGIFVSPGKFASKQFFCNPGTTFTPQYATDGVILVGCCPPGKLLSGNVNTQVSCCDAGKVQKGNPTTGYACCDPAKEVKGNVATGKFLCCDADKDYSEDKQGVGACCPPGTHVEGTVADGKYQCCPAGTHLEGADNTAWKCCKQGEKVVGDLGHGGWACCPEDQQISGDVKSGQYLCCASDHERVVDAKSGKASCCPAGSTYEDGKCKPMKPVCENGKVLINGQCACPTGQQEDKTGQCVLPAPPAAPKVQCPAGTVADASGRCIKKPCGSGIFSGDCYELIARDGRYWSIGISDHGYFPMKPSDEDAHAYIARFQFCRNEACSKGYEINPTDDFTIKDVTSSSLPSNPNKVNWWLGNGKGGAHVHGTMDHSQAGLFSITKWACGKYCLGGANDYGLVPTCPAEYVGLTFLKNFPNACMEVELRRVPCDVRDTANNCMWNSPTDPCCGSAVGGPVDCSAAAAQPAVAAKGQGAQKPM